VAIIFGIFVLSVLLLLVLRLNFSARVLERKLGAMLQDQTARVHHVEQALERLRSDSATTSLGC
jgi:hypothetical protein